MNGRTLSDLVGQCRTGLTTSLACLAGIRCFVSLLGHEGKQLGEVGVIIGRVESDGFLAREEFLALGFNGPTHMDKIRLRCGCSDILYRFCRFEKPS